MNDHELNQWINFLTHLRVDLRYVSAEAGGGDISRKADALHESLGREIASLRQIGETVPES